jgi:hypothetical protein
MPARADPAADARACYLCALRFVQYDRVRLLIEGEMSDIERARKALVARILEGDGAAPQPQRRAAFENAGLAGPIGALVQKVCKTAHAITDEDVAAARDAFADEDPIFEMVVCAAVGEATRQYEAALAALRAASAQE